MNIDVTTLAVSKNYTDKQIEKVSIKGVDLSGYVQSVNGVKPDKNGNVEVSGGNVDQSGGLTTAQIEALHGMFKVCAYNDSKDVSGAYAAFKTAFGITDDSSGGEEPDEPVTPEKTLTSISATYSGGDVPVGTAVTALTGIVVKATYSDGSTATVTGYTLSGTIAEGSNTVNVSYGGKTTTFTVTGVNEDSDLLYSMPTPTTFQSGNIIDSGIVIMDEDKDVTIVTYISKSYFYVVQNVIKVNSKFAVRARDTIQLCFGGAESERTGVTPYKDTNKDPVKIVITHASGSDAATMWFKIADNEVEEVAVTATQTSYINTTETLTVGSTNSSGTVEDFRVFNRVWTDEEIADYFI